MVIINYVCGKMLNGIKSMYANSLTCVNIKGSEKQCFRFSSVVKQIFIMFF